MKGAVLLLFLVLHWQYGVFAESDADEWGLEGEAKRELVIFSDRNFEHDTQAATGQTTGAWYSYLTIDFTFPSNFMKQQLMYSRMLSCCGIFIMGHLQGCYHVLLTVSTLAFLYISCL